VTPENDEQQVVTDLAAAAADRALRVAAGTIGQMSGAELQDKLSQLRRALASRTPREVLRQQAELDLLELDQAAYKLAGQAQADGNLLHRRVAARPVADRQPGEPGPGLPGGIMRASLLHIQHLPAGRLRSKGQSPCPQSLQPRRQRRLLVSPHPRPGGGPVPGHSLPWSTACWRGSAESTQARTPS
jgi:hypothetical protein